MKKIIITMLSLLIVAAGFVYAERRPSAREARFLTGRRGTDIDSRQQERRERNLQKTFGEKIKSLEKQIADLTARVVALEEQLNPELKIKRQAKAQRIMAPLAVDQIIYFDDEDKFKVLEVVDANNVIIELWIRKPVQQLDRSLTWTNVVTIWKAFKTTVWLRGLNTSKWADDSIVNPSPAQLFKITGTKSYDTLFEGRKTMFVLEPLSSIKYPASSIEK